MVVQAVALLDNSYIHLQLLVELELQVKVMMAVL